MAEDARRRARLRAVRRDGERVTPLELFFDLVFVLAVTQCTHVIVDLPTWTGVGRALLLLALLWWAWVGYAWLTSVVDPEEGAVRLVVFGAMAAFLVAALAVPGAFGDDALTFAIAYGVVRVAQIALFLLASRGEPELRHSVVTLAGSTAVGVALVVGGALATGGLRAAIWAGAIALDMAGPYFFGSDGWQLEPGHFAERHGLIMIIALGEAILAIGVAVDGTLSAPMIAGTVVGVALAASLWWVYFDVASLIAARRLAALPPGRERNELARDAYSYLHLPMVAGIVATAFAVETVLAHDGEVMHTVPAVALTGGVALYLAAHVAFKRRAAGIWSTGRIVAAAVLLLLLPVALTVEALVALAMVTAVVAGLIGFERIRFAELRAEERRRLHEH